MIQRTVRVTEVRIWDGTEACYQQLRVWTGEHSRGVNYKSKPRRVEYTFLSVLTGTVVTLQQGEAIGKVSDGVFVKVTEDEVRESER